MLLGSRACPVQEARGKWTRRGRQDGVQRASSRRRQQEPLRSWELTAVALFCRVTRGRRYLHGVTRLNDTRGGSMADRSPRHGDEFAEALFTAETAPEATRISSQGSAVHNTCARGDRMQMGHTPARRPASLCHPRAVDHLSGTAERRSPVLRHPRPSFL